MRSRRVRRRAAGPRPARRGRPAGRRRGDLLAGALVLALISWTAGASLSRAAAPPGNAAQLLAGRAVGDTPLMDDLHELCDTIGGRISGSPACERAIAWAERTLREAGMPKVWTEEFSIPSLYLPESARVECTDPARFTVEAVVAPFSPVSGPLEGRLVDAGKGTPEEIGELGEKALGAVGLVRTDVMDTFHALFGEYLRNSPMLAAAEKAGLRGLLLMSTRPGRTLYRHPITLNATLAAIPAALVARTDALRLARLMEDGPVTVRMDVRARTGGPVTSRNVLAEIPGRERPDEIVLLGAHLDSWDLGTGAADNGINAALVIDVARGLVELGLRPRRTVRFALFTGEEQGMWGSFGYTRTHAAELSKHVLMLDHDIGYGRIDGFYLGGRSELEAPLNRALEPVAGYGPFTHPNAAIDGSDNFDFMLSGVPNLVASQEAAPYLPSYHAGTDTFEQVDATRARINVAVASAVLWHFAEAGEAFVGRQSRREVQELLEQQELIDVMKNFGQHAAWEAGERGVFD